MAKYNPELNQIFYSLKNGQKYGCFIYNVRFPYYHTVLSYDPIKKLFFWTHYGSSANKATKYDLNWIVREIFGLTPKEFLLKYQTLTDYNQMKKAIEENGMY